MAVANGFGKVVTSGSVFMYDTGDTVNSYKGKPTTNRFSTEITDPTLDSLAIGNGASSNPQLGSGGTCIVALFNGEKVLAINRGTSSGVYYENRVYWSIPLTVGNYYSWSAWVYSTVAGPTLRIEYNGGDYAWSVAQSYNTHTGTGWERLYAYANAVASSNTQTYCFLYINTNNTIYAKDFQLENQIYPTQFTIGTRSATQGLLPIVGNSTIDLSSVSFDSNAEFLWDGTDDTLSINDTFSHKPGLPYTYEIVVYPLGSDSAYDKMLLGKPGWHTGIMYQNGYTWFRTRYGNPAFYDAGWYLLSPNTYYHLMAVYVPGTSMKFYVNGTLNGENTSVSSTLTDIGNTLNIGGSSTNYSCYVKIPVAKVYNRALTSTEVKQNYNKYKTRFNLS